MTDSLRVSGKTPEIIFAQISSFVSLHVRRFVSTSANENTDNESRQLWAPVNLDKRLGSDPTLMW